MKHNEFTEEDLKFFEKNGFVKENEDKYIKYFDGYENGDSFISVELLNSYIVSIHKDFGYTNFYESFIYQQSAEDSVKRSLKCILEDSKGCFDFFRKMDNEYNKDK